MDLLLAGDFDAADQAVWLHALGCALPGHRLWTDRAALPAGRSIEVAIVANPPPGSLAGLPGLRLIQSLWAGVDRLLADATLPPQVPLARMVCPAMNAAMAETALWAVLALHRGFFSYARQQAQGRWQQQPQSRAADWPVLLLGHGQMGRAVGAALARQGYPVTAWRRGGAAAGAADGLGASADPDVQVVSGPQALAAARARARVVINLLPLTPDTRGLIDAAWLAAMAPGAGLVNLARGAQVVEADLLAALDTGHIGQAVLDVFATEPLPAGHAFWRHPRVTVLPHVAALTDVRSAAAVVAANVAALVAGQPVQHRVARARGY